MAACVQEADHQLFEEKDQKEAETRDELGQRVVELPVVLLLQTGQMAAEMTEGPELKLMSKNRQI